MNGGDDKRKKQQKKNGVHERSLESSRDDDFVIVDKREARLYLLCRNRRFVFLVSHYLPSRRKSSC